MLNAQNGVKNLERKFFHFYEKNTVSNKEGKYSTGNAAETLFTNKDCWCKSHYQ
jgi:hypothetical protein